MGWMIIQKHHRFTMAHTEIVDSFDTIYINIPWITIVSPWMIIQYHTYTIIYHGLYHCCRFFSDLMYGSVVFSFDTMMLCKRLGEKYPLNCWIFEVQAMSRRNHCLMSRFFRGQRPIFTHVPSDMVVCLIPYPIILCISLYTVYVYIYIYVSHSISTTLL